MYELRSAGIFVTLFWYFLCQLWIFLELNEVKAFILHKDCIQIHIVTDFKTP